MSRTLLMVRGLTPPLPPVIAASGGVWIDQALSITRGGGGMPTAYLLYIQGALIRTVAHGDLFRASDMAQGITVRAMNAAGVSADSNVLGFSAFARLEWAGKPDGALVTAVVDPVTGASFAPTGGPVISTNAQGAKVLAFTGGSRIAGAIDFSSMQKVDITGCYADVADAFGYMLHHGPTINDAGSFLLATRLTGAGQFCAGANGNGTGARAATFDTLPIASDGVTMEACCDTTMTSKGVSLLRKDAADMALGGALAGPTAAGNLLNGTMTIGSYTAGAFPSTFKIIGGIVFQPGGSSELVRRSTRAYVTNLARRSSRAYGALMCAGNSVVKGPPAYGAGAAGGFRVPLFSLNADLMAVGPFPASPTDPATEGGYHRGTGGQTAAYLLTHQAEFLGEIAAAVIQANGRKLHLLMEWAANDLFTGLYTGAQLLTTYQSVLTFVRAAYPTLPIIIMRCEHPTATTYWAEIDVFNNGIAAVAALFPFVTVADEVTGLVYVDGVHPDEKSFAKIGRGVAAPVAAGILAAA